MRAPKCRALSAGRISLWAKNFKNFFKSSTQLANDLGAVRAIAKYRLLDGLMFGRGAARTLSKKA